MSGEERLERGHASETVHASAIDWGRQFLKVLEWEYAEAAAALPGEASSPEFQAAMIQAILSTLRDSGADLLEVQRLLDAHHSHVHGDEAEAAWTDGHNARRIALVDKLIQRELTAEEAVELDRLTAQLWL